MKKSTIVKLYNELDNKEIIIKKLPRMINVKGDAENIFYDLCIKYNDILNSDILDHFISISIFLSSLDDNLERKRLLNSIYDIFDNDYLVSNMDFNIILENIESFMKELGISFSFIGSEYNIKMVDRNHHIDLLLFNIKFNCYVVVELKVTEFKVEYISQVQKYMNYIDKNVKEINNNNTMGILICKRENRFVIEYCSDGRIAVREYELV